MKIDEYIVINLSKLKERIEELENDEDGKSDISEQEVIEEIISNSTQLTPLLENAFTKGERYGWDSQKSIGNIEEMKEKIKFQSLEDYINNLKLDI